MLADARPDLGEHAGTDGGVAWTGDSADAGGSDSAGVRVPGAIAVAASVIRVCGCGEVGGGEVGEVKEVGRCGGRK